MSERYELYFYIRSCRKLAPVGWGRPVWYTRPPMKIIISVKWTSLTGRGDG